MPYHLCARRACAPEPFEGPRHFPPRLIETDVRTRPDLLGQSRVGGPGARRQSGQRPAERAAMDRKAKGGRQEARNLGERHAERRVQRRREGQHLWSQLHGGGADRVRGLPRMPPLDAAPALRALSDLDLERAHGRPDDRHVDLELFDRMRRLDLCGTVGTRRRQRHDDSFVNLGRARACRAAAIRRSRFAARALRLRRRRALRKGGGLSLGGSLRGLERGRQPFDFLAQSVPLAAQTRGLAFEIGTLAAQAFDLFTQLVHGVTRTWWLPRRALRAGHAMVMPELSNLYKPNIWIGYTTHR